MLARPRGARARPPLASPGSRARTWAARGPPGGPSSTAAQPHARPRRGLPSPQSSVSTGKTHTKPTPLGSCIFTGCSEAPSLRVRASRQPTYFGMRRWQCSFWKWRDLTAVLVARVVGLRMADSAGGLHPCLLYCRGQKGRDSLLTWPRPHQPRVALAVAVLGPRTLGPDQPRLSTFRPRPLGAPTSAPRGPCCAAGQEQEGAYRKHLL